ncbi:MAG: DNA helicase RecQ [Candidatus Adiutrix sp.]|jgi:ATP-dependent DNA helicase RecQ|nr:DNA helicase RecQ [Candidatus Adiutrix sp.]
MEFASEMERTLAEVFGFHSFRLHQRELVEAVLSGRDVFAVMPTGGGKSLCYQLPARLLPGAAVVVSPLIALMKDQVDNARATGLDARAFNSVSSPAERAEIRRALSLERLDLLYVSPERLLRPDFLEELAGYRLSFFAIDEAHCVSEWGHDFRPDYLGLSVLAERFPDKSLAAFTATATRRVAEDIGARLGLRSPLTIRASFNRPNLHYQVRPRSKNPEKQIMEIIELYPGESGLVYRATRKKVEETAAGLARRGLSVRPYHAGMGDEDRRAAQDDFQRDRCQVIVATVAFGMGIDKSNVRFVIHGDLPKNLESYYQETGRAGRDGEPAHCALFYGPQEMVLWRRFAEELAEDQLRRAALEQLRHMIDFVQRDGCRRRALLAYFGEKLPGKDCGGCDVCRGEVERFEATVPAQMALSAMVRTGGRFGAGHLADILVGADSAKIRDHGHHQLPTYGVGRAYDRQFWRDLMAALLARGLAWNSGDERYPTLAAAPRARPLLRGEEKFYVLRTAVKERVRRRQEEAAPDRPPLSEELLAAFKALRRSLAEAAGVPPYVVFSDRSLREMAQIKPESPDQFLRVTGVGLHKLEKFGQAFMALVSAHLEAHPDQRP